MFPSAGLFVSELKQCISICCVFTMRQDFVRKRNEIYEIGGTRANGWVRICPYDLATRPLSLRLTIIVLTSFQPIDLARR
jgi:hypothetical protein